MGGNDCRGNSGIKHTRQSMPGALFDDDLCGEFKCYEEMPPREYHIYG
jgi:hypothetical protein